MTRLVPLAQIPHAARLVEATARRRFRSRDAALEIAQYELVSAPGCHSRPSDDPPSLGWVLTEQAAIALSTQLTTMPDGKSHHRVTYRLVVTNELSGLIKAETILRVVSLCISTRCWRSVAENEATVWLQPSEQSRKADVIRYVRKAYDSAGAGYSGRWQ